MRYNKVEVITMEKTMTLNLRVNPTVKDKPQPGAGVVEHHQHRSIKIS